MTNVLLHDLPFTDARKPNLVLFEGSDGFRELKYFIEQNNFPQALNLPDVPDVVYDIYTEIAMTGVDGVPDDWS
ncbi:hypothetical protein EOM60_03925 [Candidatus Saccharibacteria bacterium]|nr:hypothetical protein [Candidatus Saccharibacteria bacterium]